MALSELLARVRLTGGPVRRSWCPVARLGGAGVGASGSPLSFGTLTGEPVPCVALWPLRLTASGSGYRAPVGGALFGLWPGLWRSSGASVPALFADRLTGEPDTSRCRFGALRFGVVNRRGLVGFVLVGALRGTTTQTIDTSR